MTRTVRDWGAILSWLQERPGRWSLHPSLTAAPRSVVRVVRLRQTQALRDARGQIEVAVLNEWEDADTTRVDVYLRWTA